MRWNGCGFEERDAQRATRMLAVLLGVVAAIMLLPASLVLGQTIAWPELSQEARPWTRWWWHGSAVDEAELTREMENLRQAGFGGVEVTSIYGVLGREHQSITYMSAAWKEMLLHAAREARRHGMGVDMPPGSGWRLGGDFVAREHSGSDLVLTVDTVAAGETWRAASESGRLQAAAAHAEDGRRVDLTTSDSLSWQAKGGPWMVYAAYIRPSGERVKRAAPGGGGLSVDPYSETAVDRYLGTYGRRLADVPQGLVRAFFHDSFEYGGDGSAELFATFRRLRGYDLAHHLPALYGAGPEEYAARVKADYRHTLSDMVLEHLAEQFVRWSHRHGSFARYQAHGSPANLIDVYAASDIPETEGFGPLGGTDNDPLISRFASSAAHVAGRRLVSAETATWLGEHFTVTLGDLKRAIDQLLLSGINHVIYHGTAYSPSDAGWPGWLFYASTQVNARNAIWRDLPALNRYVARAQSVLQSGRPDNDILLYWPIHDSWHEPAGLRMDFRVHDPEWFYESTLGESAVALGRTGYAFDYVSDRLVQAARAEQGRISLGGNAYRLVVVPSTRLMPLKTLEHLLELARQGATIAFEDGLPVDVPGLHRLDERRRRLRKILQEWGLGERESDFVRVGSGSILVGRSVTELADRADVAREAMADLGLEFVRRRDGEGHTYFIRHAGDRPLDGWVPLSVEAGTVAIMEPMTGRTGVADSREGTGRGTEVYLQLAPHQSVVLRVFGGSVEGERWRYLSPAREPVALAGPWSVQFVAGGPVLPGAFEADSLSTWTDESPQAAAFAGTARYTTRFDAPSDADGRSFVLDLGDVAESARVRLNGRLLGTVIDEPYHLPTGPLRRRDNLLEVEVTNVSANRIRDLDRRGVEWQIFDDINFVNIDYGPFDASDWPLRKSGLLGPVQLVPVRTLSGP